MSVTVKERVNDWVLIEIIPTHGTPEKLMNSSMPVSKFIATAGIANTANCCLAPSSALSAASGLGFMISNSGDSPYPYAFNSAPLSEKGNEDLNEWWVDAANSNLTLNIIGRLV